MYFKEGLRAPKRVLNVLQRGPMSLKLLKTAYVLQREPTYVLQREPTYFEEGLRTLKRAYVLQRGPTYFKEGLRTSKRAYLCASKRVYVL